MEQQQAVITLIEKQKRKQRYNVYIDGEFVFGVHEEILIKYRLHKGQVIEQAEIEEILMEEERQHAYVAALRWLGSRARTKRELSERLEQKGYETNIIEATLSRLDREGLIDDADFANRWAEERMRLKGRGKRWIQHELRDKGVSESEIDAAIAAVDPEIEQQSALRFARKRWNALAKSAEGTLLKQKVIAAIVRRGYTWELAEKTVEIIQNEWRNTEDA